MHHRSYALKHGFDQRKGKYSCSYMYHKSLTRFKLLSLEGHILRIGNNGKITKKISNKWAQVQLM